MRWLLLIIISMFTTLICKGQDSIFVYKEKNLLTPNGYIRENNNMYIDIIPKYKEVEVISDSYDFLFTGFEKYGYTLCIDTMRMDTTDNKSLGIITRNNVIGYFDLVNNTDSTIEVRNINMYYNTMLLTPEESYVLLVKSGESKKIKFIITRGLLHIAHTDFDSPLIPTVEKDSMNNIINNKKSFIDNLNLVKKLKSSNAYYDRRGKLTIRCNNNIHIIYVVFRIPVKYIRNIEYSHIYSKFELLFI